MKPVHVAAILLISLLYPMSAPPQGNVLVIVQKPITAQHLDGTVRMGEQRIPDVHVEECDPAWEHILASTRTDSRGHFHLNSPSTGPIHYIKIYAPGYNIHEYKIKISKKGSSEFQLKISVGT